MNGISKLAQMCEKIQALSDVEKADIIDLLMEIALGPDDDARRLNWIGLQEIIRDEDD